MQPCTYTWALAYPPLNTAGTATCHQCFVAPTRMGKKNSRSTIATFYSSSCIKDIALVGWLAFRVQDGSQKTRPRANFYRSMNCLAFDKRGGMHFHWHSLRVLTTNAAHYLALMLSVGSCFV